MRGKRGNDFDCNFAIVLKPQILIRPRRSDRLRWRKHAGAPEPTVGKDEAPCNALNGFISGTTIVYSIRLKGS